MEKKKIKDHCWVCDSCGSGAGYKHVSVINWKNNAHKCIFCGKGKMYKTKIEGKWKH